MKHYETEHTEDAERRCETIGAYMLDQGTTVRDAAHHFGISKSTVHKDVTEKLQKINRPLYEEVKKLLEKNKMERHIRGGLATRRKYQNHFSDTQKAKT